MRKVENNVVNEDFQRPKANSTASKYVQLLENRGGTYCERIIDCGWTEGVVIELGHD